MRLGKRAFIGFWITCLFLMLVIANCDAQDVEHNYKVGPQSTSCDSLILEALNPERAIEKIRDAKFRFQQSFKLTRRQGFKEGEFYSCDGEIGFLIIKYNESEFLYVEVKNEIWDKLKTSQDPEGYFLEIKDDLRNID